MTQRYAITRIEILVVVVVASFAVGVVAMILARHRDNAQRAQCVNNLRKIGQAVHAYHDASSADKDLRTLPPSRLADGFATWAVLLAPYLQNEHPLNHWELEKSYFAQSDEVRQARLIVFFCPARQRADTLSQAGDVDAAGQNIPGALGDYASVAADNKKNWTGPDANGALVIAEVLERKDDQIVKWQGRTSLASLIRGESYTMLIGEKYVAADHMGDAAFGDGSLYNGAHPASFSRIAGPGYPLADAIDVPFNNNFGSWHRGICNFLMADTSVRPMANDTSEKVLGELARRGE